MRSTAFSMPPLPVFGAAFPRPLDALPAAINHLLAAEPWASAQLAPHAGKTLCVVVEPFRVALTVTSDGMVARADAVTDPATDTAMAPDTTVTLPASALPRVLIGGMDAVMRDVRIAGDAEFAHVVSTLAKTLRWDAEEDLSKVIGDAASHRVVAAVRSAHGEIRRTGERATAGVAEYLLEENPQLVRPRAVVELTDAVRTLRDDLARLEKRVDRLALATAAGR